jgi:hypothetical protein
LRYEDKKELDVDFIGGTGPLTKEEEKRVSDFIKQHKAKQKLVLKKVTKKMKTKKRVTVRENSNLK